MFNVANRIGRILLLNPNQSNCHNNKVAVCIIKRRKSDQKCFELAQSDLTVSWTLHNVSSTKQNSVEKWA